MEKEAFKMKKQNDNKRGRVRIRFELDPRDHPAYECENLWAEPVEVGEFRILNSPFLVFGVSANDIVKARKKQGAYRFWEVVRRGGHSTYRIFLSGGRTINDPAFQRLWRRIAAFGCTFENANDLFVTVDVPPPVDVGKVYRLLKEGELNQVWVFEEAHYAGAPNPAP